MRLPLLRLLALAAVFAAATDAAAQCTPIPGTGCPTGSLPVQCGGTAMIGQQMKFGCPNSGRAAQQLLLAGPCGPTWSLPGVSCTGTNCAMAVGPTGIIAIPTGFSSIVATVPNNPALIGRSLCLQCVDVISGPGGLCLAMSEGVQVTFS